MMLIQVTFIHFIHKNASFLAQDKYGVKLHNEHLSNFCINILVHWFLCADVYLTNNTSLERFPIMAASMLWPVAVVVALIRIVTGAYNKP